MKSIRIAIFLLAMFVTTASSEGEDRLAKIRDMLVDAVYEKNPGGRMKELVDGGLDRIDGEEILLRLNKALATCLVDAIREYSSEMSLDFEEQIDLLEVDLIEGVGGKYLSSLDQEKLEQILYPCTVTAHQAAGLIVPQEAP